MEYKFTFVDGSEAIAHYGVLGMKWGVRKDDSVSRIRRGLLDSFADVGNAYYKDFSDSGKTRLSEMGLDVSSDSSNKSSNKFFWDNIPDRDQFSSYKEYEQAFLKAREDDRARKESEHAEQVERSRQYELERQREKLKPWLDHQQQAREAWDNGGKERYEARREKERMELEKLREENRSARQEQIEREERAIRAREAARKANEAQERYEQQRKDNAVRTQDKQSYGYAPNSNSSNPYNFDPEKPLSYRKMGLW